MRRKNNGFLSAWCGRGNEKRGTFRRPSGLSMPARVADFWSGSSRFLPWGANGLQCGSPKSGTASRPHFALSRQFFSFSSLSPSRTPSSKAREAQGALVADTRAAIAGFDAGTSRACRGSGPARSRRLASGEEFRPAFAAGHSRSASGSPLFGAWFDALGLSRGWNEEDERNRNRGLPREAARRALHGRRRAQGASVNVRSSWRTAPKVPRW